MILTNPKPILLFLAAIFCSGPLLAQNIDIDNLGNNFKDKLKQKPFKLSGGVSASSVFYTGNSGSGRNPFTYFLNGNVNLAIYGFNVPLSFSFTNTGLKYQYPNLPNRLSLHPKYKWITGHIGEVSMSFSPYSYNGMPFSGIGVELAPRGNWKYGAFYGRLQRAVEYRPDNGNTLAAYRRMGYGVKMDYDKGKRKWGMTVFKAKDDLSSLLVKPDSLQIYPQQNTVITMHTAFPVIPNFIFQAEYGLTALTRDIRAPKYADSNDVHWLIKMLGDNQSTNIFHAIKTQLNYVIGSSSIGVGYERIDPGYQTLGSYYFANDLENITANFARSLFKGKVNIGGNVGFQRDDLDKKKTGGSRRTVGAINLSFNASQRFTTSLSYSNFQTFTNIKPQFQYINQQTPFDNLDTLNYRQLSQNANVNINYVLSTNKDQPQNLNVNLSFQDMFDEQGGVVSTGNSSQFFNFSGSWSVTKVPKAMSIATSLNLTYNTIGAGNEMLTWGPTVAMNRQFFEKKLRTGTSVSYNQSLAGGAVQAKVLSFRLTVGFVLKKKHNFNLSTIGMWNSTPTKPVRNDITSTMTYNYNF